MRAIVLRGNGFLPLLRHLERARQRWKKLESKKIEYGFFDDPHYSGLNVATLAFYLDSGTTKILPFNFMLRSALSNARGMRKNLARLNKAIMQGDKDYQKVVKDIAQQATEFLQQHMRHGGYTVRSEAWAKEKGFNDALYHYGDLIEAASYKVVSK